MTGPLTLERFAADMHSFGERIGTPERDAARDCLSDAIACASVGVSARSYDQNLKALDQVFGPTENAASVWFASQSTNPFKAAFLNSLAVSAHDLDDGNRAATGHPGGAVIPAVLAEIEALHSNVDPLGAIAFGYEAGIRLAEARKQDIVPTMATGRWASYASAAASCYVAGDDQTTLAHALAHAGSLAPQLVPPDPRRVDGLKEATPWGVVVGMIAARMARAGIPGPTYLLEHHPDYLMESLDELGTGPKPAILDTYFKLYACCRWIHPALDAILEMAKTKPFEPSEIDSIEVHTFKRSLTLSNSPIPTTIEEAHYSFPFCVALALHEGPEAFLPITEESLARGDIHVTAGKVTLVADPALERRFPAMTPSAVRVKSRSGTREKAVATAKGDPSHPFTRDALQAKHRHLLDGMAPGIADRFGTLVYRESTVDCRALTTELTTRPRNEPTPPDTFSDSQPQRV
jgi:2-methylcitrate dehydratase PrpD